MRIEKSISNLIKKRTDFFSLVLLIGIWTFTSLSYSILPENIAIHYDESGKADRFGHKSNIFNLPVISTLFYLGLIYLNGRIKEIYKKNKTKAKFTHEKYKSVSKMISVSNLSFVLFFGILIIRKIQVLKNDSDELGLWFLPLSFGIILIPVTYSLLKLIRK
jgi:uncharacterized membrane protein